MDVNFNKTLQMVISQQLYTQSLALVDTISSSMIVWLSECCRVARTSTLDIERKQKQMKYKQPYQSKAQVSKDW